MAPRTIGYKSKPDFSHGLVKAFFEFFYVPDGGQPVGTFMDVANKVVGKYPEMEPLIKGIGDVCNEMYDYLKPPGGGESPYNLYDLTQTGAAQKVYDYMKKANKLGKTVIQTTDKANPNKIASGLKGLRGMLSKAKNIFTSSFGPVKKKSRIGFKFKGESVNESKKTQYITDQEQADKVVATFLKQGKTKEWIKSNIGRNRTELKYIGRALKTVKKSANEVDLHSKLSRGHKPDWYQLNTPEFKPFDKSKDDLEEAEYQGRKVKLNKPMPGDVKKFKVYVSTGKKNKDGTLKIKKVEFGQKGARIKKDNPEARKSFRARHKCDQKKDKTSAGYWSCKKW